MPDIVIAEFMDESAVTRLQRYETLCDPTLVDRPQELAATTKEARAWIHGRAKLR